MLVVCCVYLLVHGVDIIMCDIWTILFKDSFTRSRGLDFCCCTPIFEFSASCAMHRNLNYVGNIYAHLQLVRLEFWVNSIHPHFMAIINFAIQVDDLRESAAFLRFFLVWYAFWPWVFAFYCIWMVPHLTIGVFSFIEVSFIGDV